MKTKHRWPPLGSAALLLVLTFAGSCAAVADEGDPPTRVARLAYVEGSVSLQPGGTDEWVDAPLNRPLTTGDAVWSDVNSRVELQLDGSLVRLSSRTSISFLNVADHVTQIQLTAGTMMVRVRRLDDDESYEIDTPNLALSLLQPGLYRVSVDDSGAATTVAVRSGHGEVTGGGADFPVDAGQQVAFTGTDSLNADAQPSGPGASPFDVWSANRDGRWNHSVSANYVSPDVVGYTDLDDQGDWNSTPDYGYVWFPRRVQPGWAPYHYGHWAYIAPWGYTWVDDQPWGFAPFHYGRWISENGAWGWVPCPPRARGGEGYVRPVYAPALVAWVGAGAGVAWFALGPREVYVPSYPVSRAYVNNINVSNTIVNRTVVNNIYNTTLINNRNVNITYVNRGVRGAIAATTTQAFTSAQPVATHTVQFDPRAGRVETFAPAAVPTRQAVLGLGRQGAPRPPTALQTRPVVARVAPPPPPPTFERRQQAIQQNGGRPLSMAAVRQIQPQVAQRPMQVRIAPQVTQGNNRPGADLNPQRNDSPRVQQPVDRAPPAGLTPRPPQVPNPAFPQQHLQDQQRQQQIQALQQRQAQERDQQQAQQQERDRQQLARQQQEQDARRQQQQQDQQRQQQSEQQRQQQLQQQHQQQQQVQALQQQRAQEQLQRQQQKPQQDNQTRPPVRHDDKPSKPERATDADH